MAVIDDPSVTGVVSSLSALEVHGTHQQDAQGMQEDEESKRLRLSFQTPSQVTDMLYVGSNFHARNFSYLEEAAIQGILCVHDRARYPPDRFKFLHHPVSDYGDANLQFDVFPKCFAFLDAAMQENRKVLLHCRSGVNRSPTVAIAWLMKTKKWTLKKAYAFVKSKRPQTCPHEKYFEQLRCYDVHLHGQHSIVDEDVPKSLQQYLRELRVDLQTEQARRASASANSTGSNAQSDHSAAAGSSALPDQSGLALGQSAPALHSSATPNLDVVVCQVDDSNSAAGGTSVAGSQQPPGGQVGCAASSGASDPTESHAEDDLELNVDVLVALAPPSVEVLLNGDDVGNGTGPRLAGRLSSGSLSQHNPVHNPAAT